MMDTRGWWQVVTRRRVGLYWWPVLEKVAQQRDQRLVGGWHRIVGELVRAHPGQCLVLARPRYAFPAPAQIQRHQQMEPLVLVRGEGERREAGGGDVDPQLLLQFADQRGFGC